MASYAHFAIQVNRMPLWRIVHNVCFRCSRFVHRRRGRSGHLFERRYRAGLVDGTGSLTRVVRYIHRNPIEAGMVEDAMATPSTGARRDLGHGTWLVGLLA